MDRSIENSPYLHLIGAYVSVAGTIYSIRNKNPFTYSDKRSRQKLIMLRPVTIGGIEFDHVWLYSCSALRYLKVGDRVNLIGKLGVYEYQGEKKFNVRLPYSNVEIIPPTRFIPVQN